MLIGENAKVWNVNPLIVTVDRFLDEPECRAVIALAEGRLERATVLDEDYGSRTSDNRSNSDCAIDQRRHPALAAICLKLSVLLRIPFGNAEKAMVLHYAPGQEFRPHRDGFTISDRDEAYRRRVDRDGGQRLFTTICYLNEVEEGGATTFPLLGLSIAPARGRLLIFANTLAGSRDAVTLAEHAGTPVVRGEKWAATVWWREHPATTGTGGQGPAG